MALESGQDLVSHEEATQFLKIRLGIDEVPFKLKQKPIDLLDEISKKFLCTVPYQNITHTSVPFPKRTTPTPRECVKAVLEGYGGLCWTLNTFMYELLKALGYQVICVIASVAMKDTQNHVVCICKDVVEAGDHYLVDIGYGFPCFTTVCLDFEQETDPFIQSFQTFKYIKEGDWFCRLHKQGSHSRYMPYPRIENGWIYAYYFQMIPCDLTTVMQVMEQNVYRNSKMFFNTEIRLVRFVNERCIAIKGKYVLIEGEDHTFQSTDLDEMEDSQIAALVCKYYPEIPEYDVDKAIVECHVMQRQIQAP